MRCHDVRPNRGFSLLEVVVAMTLGMVLLGAVWTMFQMLTRRQESELRQAEQSQVTRALHQRFGMDLKNLVSIADQRPQPKPAIQPSWTLRPSGGRFPIPSPTTVEMEIDWEVPPVLVGNSQELLLQVYLPPFEQTLLSERLGGESESYERDSSKISRQVPGTKFVRYLSGLAELASETEHLQDEASLTDAIKEPELEGAIPELIVGLTRQEFFESPVEDEPENSDGSGSRLPPLNRHEQEAPQSDSQSTSKFSSDEPDLNEGVEDIANLRFEFFDGQAWTDHWDSRISNQLPAAIRIRYRYLTKQELREWQARDEAVWEDNLASESSTTEDSKRAFPPTEGDPEEFPEEPEVELVLLVKPRPFSRLAVREMFKDKVDEADASPRFSGNKGRRDER